MSLHLLCRTIPTQRPDLLPIDKEQNRHGEHGQGDERQYRRRPRDPQIIIHRRREQGEARPRERPNECVCRDGAIGIHQVHIDDVVEPLHEDDQDPHPDGYSGEHLRYPGNVWAAGPRKPEQAGGEDGAAEDHRREALFGYNFAVLLQFARKAGFRHDRDDDDAEDDADGDTEEGEGPHAGVPAALLLKADGVGFEEKVEHPVDGGQIDGDENEDGFHEEHGEGPEEVFRQDLSEVDLVLVDLGVDGPIAGLEPQFLGSSLEDHRGEGFGYDE